ncbi:methionine--tRNA ligase [Oceanobacillus sp. CAU 1775]
MSNIFIGGAWPYANGSLHVGHLAALLPGDVIARYYRQKGEEVLYVSGSDSNGTPISIRANQENTTVKAIADKYHEEFVDTFTKLGFSYDFYTRTDANHHHETVQKIFLQLLENGYLYKKNIEQAYCLKDEQFLPDRFVEGACPNCGLKARGDQCDHCSKILDPLDLLEKKCKICGEEPVIRETEHFYFSFSAFQSKLESYVASADEDKRWRDNAIQLTKRYIEEGIQDRAVTRDLPNGIEVPVAGFEGKKIYVWIEAVAGYYTASKEWGKINKKDIGPWWNSDAIPYYIHGKDNIPFHTVIWPAILMGLEIDGLPKHIVSNEYMTLEKRKISTRENWAVWAPDLLETYHPDSIRYFLIMNAPENRDADFSWREFIYSHNGELLGAYANFVNRTLKFIEKSFEGKVEELPIDEGIGRTVQDLYHKVGQQIEEGNIKRALEIVFEFIREANRYFDERKPWLYVKEDLPHAKETLTNAVYIILNVAQLLRPFLPFATEKVAAMLHHELNDWNPVVTLPTFISNIEPLYERIDVKQIDEEIEKLNQDH